MPQVVKTEKGEQQSQHQRKGLFGGFRRKGDEQRARLFQQRGNKTAAVASAAKKPQESPLRDTQPDSRNDSDSSSSSGGEALTATQKKQRRLKSLFSNECVEHSDEGSKSKKSTTQLAVCYHQFSMDPAATMKVICEEGLLEPSAEDHVVIKVQASTVTLGDCLIRRGFSYDIINPISLPAIPGHDVVGHIVARGKNAESIGEGERVAALVRTGGNARLISVPVSSLVKVPRGVDSAEAAAMVTIYTSAYQALRAVTRDGPIFNLDGKKVLILGGMEAIGQALIQLCLKSKAEVHATAPRGRHAYIRNVLGATPVPEQPVEWLPIVEGEMDIVFDGICEDALETSSKALKQDTGQLVCFGDASLMKEKEMGVFGAPLSAHMNKLWSRTKSRCTTHDIWESFKSDPETYKKNLLSLFQLLKWDKIKPHIARRVTLTEVPKAHAKLEEGKVRGILVCLPWKRVSPKDCQKEGDQRES